MAELTKHVVGQCVHPLGDVSPLVFHFLTAAVK
jgi:hypothetical protein